MQWEYLYLFIRILGILNVKTVSVADIVDVSIVLMTQQCVFDSNSEADYAFFLLVARIPPPFYKYAHESNDPFLQFTQDFDFRGHII